MGYERVTIESDGFRFRVQKLILERKISDILDSLQDGLVSVDGGIDDDELKIDVGLDSHERLGQRLAVGELELDDRRRLCEGSNIAVDEGKAVDGLSLAQRTERLVLDKVPVLFQVRFAINWFHLLECLETFLAL